MRIIIGQKVLIRIYYGCREKSKEMVKGNSDMQILLWLLFGAVVGWVASMLMGSNSRMGLVKNIVVGLIGSLIGGWLSTLLGLGTFAAFSFNSFLVALAGAVLLLFVLNQLGRRR